ncbi:hypothetical protein [Arcobacter sp.]|uniref:hypothetical protein n=1 Tax=unclassified Arcobacter TaxID=2593671 RepID=UPI003B00BD99
MKSSFRVRSLIYNDNDNKYIKQIDDRGIGSFIELLSEDKKELPVIYNFSPVITAIHSSITEAFAKYENDELKRKHSAMFNNWTRLKSFTNETLLCQATLEVMNESEKVLTWIHTRLNEMENKRRDKSAIHEQYLIEESKTNKLNEIIIEIDTFIESLLCNIHSTLLINPDSISNDCVLTMHIEKTYDFLNDILRYESGVSSGSNDIWERNNIVEQSCMEEVGIEPDLLLYFLNIGKKKSEVISDIFSRSTIKDSEESYTKMREKKLTWAIAGEHNVFRANIIIYQMKKLISLMKLIERIKSKKFTYDDGEDSLKIIENKISEISSDKHNKTNQLTK